VARMFGKKKTTDEETEEEALEKPQE